MNRLGILLLTLFTILMMCIGLLILANIPANCLEAGDVPVREEGLAFGTTLVETTPERADFYDRRCIKAKNIFGQDIDPMNG